MFQRKPRRFRGRPNGRNHHASRGDNSQNKLRLNSFSNNHPRNSFRTFQSAEKLFEKYNTLAKEAMTSGDKTLAENYLQHADHFIRIIEDKNKSRNQSKPNVIDKPTDGEKNLSDEGSNNQKHETENKN